MANIAFDFLASSFLFDERYIDDEYRIVPEKELVLELNKYHDYIEHNFVQIVSEVQSGNEMNVSIEVIDDLPDEQFLKQLALYLDKVIISDPIFEIALHENTSQMPIGELMHLDMEKNINRRKLAYVAKYMKWSTPLVARQFIVSDTKHTVMKRSACRDILYQNIHFLFVLCSLSRQLSGSVSDQGRYASSNSGWFR